MPSLLELMRPEDREKAVKRFEQRMLRRNDLDNRISNEIYTVAEFGYYFGWAGISAIKHNEVTLKEVYALLEGARKVWYVKLVEQANITRVAVESASPIAKKSDKARTFRDGMKPFVKEASK